MSSGSGRLAGYILPAAFMTGMTYGLGKLLGQDDQSALTSAITGVGGAVGGEIATHRAFPNASINLSIKGRQVPIHYGGIIGSLAGGYAGTALGDSVNHVINPNRTEVDGNPLLLSADDLAVPALSIAKAFI